MIDLKDVPEETPNETAEQFDMNKSVGEDEEQEQVTTEQAEPTIQQQEVRLTNPLPPTERCFLKTPFGEIEMTSAYLTADNLLENCAGYLLWYNNQFGNSKERNYAG